MFDFLKRADAGQEMGKMDVPEVKASATGKIAAWGTVGRYGH